MTCLISLSERRQHSRRGPLWCTTAAVVVVASTLLQSASAEWSCALQVGNGCAGETSGPDLTGINVISAASSIYFGSDVVSTNDGQVYVLDEAPANPTLMAITAETNAVAWSQALPAAIRGWENTLLITHWPPGNVVIVHATDFTVSNFYGFATNGSALWTFLGQAPMVGGGRGSEGGRRRFGGLRVNEMVHSLQLCSYFSWVGDV